MRIYLLGFMGSGKSTLGQRIAGAFQVSFFDTDNVVEAHSGMTISEIFSTYGENYFRHLEADILRQTSFYSKSLISTGGGLPCFDNNMEWMKENGITVYLQWPDDILRQHLLQIRNTRPLIAQLTDKDAGEKIDDLLSIRKPIYEQSSITLELTGDMEYDYNLLEKACKYVW